MQTVWDSFYEVQTPQKLAGSIRQVRVSHKNSPLVQRQVQARLCQTAGGMAQLSRILYRVVYRLLC